MTDCVGLNAGRLWAVVRDIQQVDCRSELLSRGQYCVIKIAALECKCLGCIAVPYAVMQARNVLLKSAGGDARGFVAKVSDFGLSVKIDPTETHVSNIHQVRLDVCA